MIKKYIKNNITYYMVNNLYLGIHPITKKEIRKSKKGFKTKREAQIYINKLKSEYDEGNLLVKNKKTSMQEVSALFLNYYKDSGIKIGSYALVEREINYLVKYFSTAAIEDIKYKHIQQYLDKRGANIAANTLNNYAAKLNMLFKFAIRTEIIKENPMQNVVPKKKKLEIVNEEELYYSREELKDYFSLLDKVKSRYKIYFKPLFRLLSFSGARIGELLALTWDDFDFKNKIVHIRKNVISVNREFHIQTPKSKSSARSITLDDITINILLKLKKEQKELMFYLGKKNNDNIVFLNPKTGYFKNSFFLSTHSNLCIKYNFKRITLHGFRHTHCSLLFEAGASIQEVQRRLGHSNIQTTMNIYNHISKKIQEQTSEKFAKYVNF